MEEREYPFFQTPTSAFQCNASNVVIETIKRAEDDQGIIIRTYESQRRRGSFIITTIFPIAEAFQTNILEENIKPLEVRGNQIHASIKPFQIMTLRLIPDSGGNLDKGD